MGAVSFIQRFGGAINSNVHYHCAVIDGVFSQCNGALCCHEASALDDADIVDLEGVVAKRVLRAERFLTNMFLIYHLYSFQLWHCNTQFFMDDLPSLRMALVSYFRLETQVSVDLDRPQTLVVGMQEGLWVSHPLYEQ